MLFDTHAHFDDAKFDADRDAVIQSLKEYGVGYVTNIGADMASSQAAVSLAEKYDFIYAAVGVHPSETEQLSEKNMEVLRDLALAHDQVRAIGEIGLDYHFAPYDAEKQQYWFRRQIQLAKELKLPIVVHDRDSKGDGIKILKEEKVSHGVMHCFSGSAEIARELVKMGFMISFTGVLTFKNARRAAEACAAVPMDRLMIETDCPYMAPEPFRGRRCEPCMVPQMAKKIAEIKGVDAERVAEATRRNAYELFRLA